jgi:tetratricopeptide (TPR) repeat protein
MIAPRDPTYRLLHRELVLLVTLAAAAMAAFFLTRWFADVNAAQHRRDASAWYERGRAALQAGDATHAVAALRRASRLDPRSRETVFALATAYAASGDDGEARRLLAGLREASPDDAEVNLQLGRLEARSGDLALATRYYHAAVDALWRVEQAPQRRPIRIELIKLLLARGDTSRALSEALRLTPDLPDTVPAQIEAGELFLAAGDAGRALARFTAALLREPHNPAALAGAGRSAFAQGEYARAQRYLAATEDTSAAVAEARQLTDLVLRNDPLAVRLSRRERIDRLSADLAQAAERVTACAATLRQSGGDAADLEASGEQMAAVVTSLGRDTEADAIESGTELAYRAVRRAAQSCPPPSPFDRALMLIGRAHGFEAAGS